jgi:hypothetical protein
MMNPGDLPGFFLFNHADEKLRGGQVCAINGISCFKRSRGSQGQGLRLTIFKMT